jgi:carboxylate-amine ligase
MTRTDAPSSDDSRRSSRLTLGVEEEFHLVDLRSRRLTPRAGEVLAALSESKGTFTTELQQTTVETNTEVTDTLEGLRRNLLALRTDLSIACDRLGIGAAAAGTMPLSSPIIITENARFRRMLADYQLLVREQLICGMQVHVGIDNPDTAATLIDRVSPWLPPLLALSASSPFAQGGQDTGYASSRTLIWSRWPTTGSAGAFSSAAAYDAQVQDLIASGVISDRGMIYFDVRPSSHVPTIELRVCDACPLVDTVVLIAALFRAVVRRELDRLARGEPSRAVAPALHRAATWRAARSGLEGELVDLEGPHAVPAGVLVRGMLNELRPELERDGDWTVVAELCEAALTQGTAAARQRETFRRRQSIKDVVDLIVAETASRIDTRVAPPSSPLIPGYHPIGYDEAVLPDGRPRASHAAVLEHLIALPASELRAREAALAEAQRKSGVLFRVAGQKDATAFPIDIVPRVLTGEDWSRLQGGTAQRARALDAFVGDIYGAGAIFRDGVLPPWVVTDAPGYRAAGTAPGPKQRRVQVSGFDVVRDHEGRWLVLEDNVRSPSGAAFAMYNRRLMREALPDLLALADLHDPEVTPELLRRTLEESAPPARNGDLPRLALLTPGPSDSAFFEHRTLAEAMNIPLVHSTDLLVEDNVVHRVENGKRGEPIDVIYLRMDELFTKSAGADGRPLGAKLIQAVRAGTLTIANAIGNGVADDKAIYDLVPKLIKYYLGEHPLLDQVPTYHCGDPDQRAHVLARLDQLVVKPVDGYGGFGVTIGPQASDRELHEAHALIEEQPTRWIAQEVVSLSTHPTFHTAGHASTGRSHERSVLRPAHVDLRVFVYYGESPVVVPAALTRVAPPGSLIVNSSRGGGAKDTWILR